MNTALLKKLLPGILPLLIFILADEIWGTRVGLYVALAFGTCELFFYRIRDKKIDRFILLDTSLLLVLGVISIALENDLFFKIKPALIEFILLAIIGFSLWGPKNLIMAMSQRYTGELKLDEGQEKMMKLNLMVMFWLTALHILLVLYSAKYLSDEAWAFVSGGLFYIIFAAWFGGIWIASRLKALRYRNDEWFPIVNEEGVVTGKAPRRVCHDGKSMLLHPVVHLHLINKEGKLYLQKRSMKKDIQPGKWDTSVGGHIAPDESVEDALKRESYEELRLSNINPQFIHKYIWESSRERELVFSFITVSDSVPEADRNEIEEGRYWGLDEIIKNLGKGLFTPNFEHEFNLLKEKTSSSG
jgi:isopentenyldiphosphate isomerase/intracellular septation protein A